MLYQSRPDPLSIRHRCRDPRCGGNLKAPESNPRDAFCCKGCEESFYRSRCRVCEALFSRKTKRRQVCGRDQCRYQFKTNSERFFGSRSLSTQNRKIAHNDARSAHSTGLKTGAKSGRGWRRIAGPAGDPVNYQNLPEPPKPRPVLIGPSTPPVNLIGGHRFPGAPQLDPDLMRAILKAEGILR